MRNKFSTEVKEAISLSAEEARRFGDNSIAIEHLLSGLIKQGNNKAVQVLKSLGVNIAELQEKIALTKADINTGNRKLVTTLPLTENAERVIRDAVTESGKSNSKNIETEHVLLAILCNNEDPAVKILQQWKVTYDEVIARCKNNS